MTETPYWVILFCVSIICYYSVRKGFIVLGRVAQVIVPSVIFSVILFTLLNINNIDLKNLMPIYVDSGFKALLFGSFNVSFRFYHIYFIAIFSPMLKEKKAVKDVFKYSLIILTSLYIIMTATCIASFGVAQCKSLNFLYYTFIRQINVFNFIERIEFIGVMGWLIGAFISISLHTISILTLLSQTIKTKINNRFQLLVIILIILTISKYTPISEADIIQQVLSYKYLPYIQGIFIFIIPSIICIIYLIRRKSIDKKISEIRL